MRDKKRVKYRGFYARLWGLGFLTIRGPFLQFPIMPIVTVVIVFGDPPQGLF